MPQQQQRRRRLHAALALLALSAATLVPLGRPAQAAADADVAGAAAMRAKVKRDGQVRVIVEVPRGAAPSASGGGVGVAAVGHAVRGARQLGSLPYLALEVDAAGLEALLASGAVRKIGENRRVRPHLRRSVPLVRAPVAWTKGARGAGQTIVVIDTGVRADHPFLAGRVAANFCSASDCGGGARVVERAGIGRPFAGCPARSVVRDHGTHVAGIAAGRGSGFSGVAPDARVVSIRVFRCDEADWEHIIRALDYVATNLARRFKIAAVNMSLGDEAATYARACDGADATNAALSAAVAKLRRLGIATVASTGNGGRKRGIGAPGCLRDVIAVGSTERNDTVSWFSNSAANLDLLAPGSGIVSSLASGGYGAFDGTSMAAPHVAGAIAAIRSKLPKASVAAIRGALVATGRPIKDPENGIARPRLDVGRALARLMAARPAPTASSSSREVLRSPVFAAAGR